ncbi:hypothetical protein BJY16_005377 [Actinoplanes octamycinicus]|uniref:Uncharacterized protein n=1 Tax=Actinoplanes octamycinicus TaxID=135948 RepID=A0A7W7M9E0_9ACTN|nr:hypothetical protein [Actinoplanes octamycinicus]MBB4741918.1 hypothetical protein [Actinoplanes octamycinicus]GIE60682.1 hypothetical protein Aoc01nite_60840 [Actinoplanes octamycinicus]
MDLCTLPTADRPSRLAEFDDLFATALLGQRRLSPTTLCWDLDPASEATVRDLTARESECCSFTFRFQASDDALCVQIEVPGAQAEILDALQQRAAGRVRS